jgi:NADH:ubiquinone oxidoreductase subunit 2 (subunit N)
VFFIITDSALSLIITQIPVMLDTIQSSLLFLLFFVVQGVAAAMSAMDVIALLIGLAILIFGLCALIGFYARRRGGQ